MRRLLPAILWAVACAVPAAASAQSAADTIRGHRAASNAALERGDLAAFLASIDADYVATAGNGGHVRSRAELGDVIGGIFASTPGLFFVRTADAVRVSETGTRAVETGHWVEMTPSSAGPQPGRGGAYTAYWRRVDGAWVIHAEVFVTLTDGGVSGPPPPARRPPGR